MSISEKIKAINNKIDQSKAHYNLDKQPAKISDLSSGYGWQIRIFDWQRCFAWKKHLLEKAAATKRFKYVPLGKEWKAQTSVAAR